MTELLQILAHYQKAPRPSDLALATVVRVEGSAYRRPGARMLLGETGILAGSVSGGCLEQDVLLRARSVLAKNRPLLVPYDSTHDEGEFMEFAMGCKGRIEILIEPVAQDRMLAEFAFLRRHAEERQRCVLSKVTAVEGASPLQLGSYFHGLPSGEGSRVQPASEHDVAMVRDAELCLRDGKGKSARYESPQSTVEMFHEVLKPPTMLTVFGTGIDAVPLVKLAKAIGFFVTVVDCRGTYLFPGRFASADLCRSLPAEKLASATWEPASAAVVMTHNYPLDRTILTAVLAQPFAYLGLLGPKKRAEQLLEEVRPGETLLGNDALPHFFAPIGLDIGATNPEEIALAILAEIRASLAGRRGGFLRERTSPIHPRGAL